MILSYTLFKYSALENEGIDYVAKAFSEYVNHKQTTFVGKNEKTDIDIEKIISKFLTNLNIQDFYFISDLCKSLNDICSSCNVLSFYDYANPSYLTLTFKYLFNTVNFDKVKTKIDNQVATINTKITELNLNNLTVSHHLSYLEEEVEVMENETPILKKEISLSFILTNNN